MNDLIEQYNLELRYQEKKSNVRTLRSFLWFFIAMVVIWVLTAVDFFVIDTGMVTSAVGYSSGKGRNVREIVKQADESMYIDKARCKQSGDEISRRE